MQPFTYSKAATSDDVIAALTGEGVQLIAGGTTLFDLMKLGIEQPRRIVDVSGIGGLDEVTLGPNELVFGALASMTDVASSPALQENYPVLAESLLKAASQQLRNMATVGGNLLQRTRCNYFRNGAMYACNKRNPGSGCAALGGVDRGHALLGGSEACIAVYPGDWAVALTALNASVDTQSPRGLRSIPLADLYRLPGQTPDRDTELAADEMILRIRVPAASYGRASTYHKIRDRESYAFALVSAAVMLDLDGDRVRAAHIALGGVATRPWRAPQAEALLTGQTLTPARALDAGRAAFEGATAGHHNAFKIELGARAVADALMIAQQRSTGQ
ncbi:xanthine dehydrogenase family protein subunit M [Fertoebacter nigrum]|uniref:Xanthine dehydrogenase family protein subunit M n=1 Tax=Fertoeibacter niger TaxID=2656921 RepID=A0A8X8H103_9RHOB|nr:xanthine dehydrogenase family protein subunit M [Fertoeibacter niger]NUB44980.1 xanthine dehydrogenase family protein subunit M [Fertoeibacter niger]